MVVFRTLEGSARGQNDGNMVQKKAAEAKERDTNGRVKVDYRQIRQSTVLYFATVTAQLFYKGPEFPGSLSVV